MSKMASFGSAFGALFGLFTRLAISILQYVTLLASLVFSTYLVGKYTNRTIQSRKEVVELVYWRDPKKSVAVLATVFLLLFLFQKYSFHSVIIYTALVTLVATIGFRGIKLLEGHFKKTDGTNPFQHYLDIEVSIPQDKLHAQVDSMADYAVMLFNKIRHIYLVANLVDSVKFGLLLYSLTYVASWFSGLALVITFVVSVFAIPKIYELYKEPIDHYIKIAQEQIDHYSNIAQEKLPFLKVTMSEKKEE